MSSFTFLNDEQFFDDAQPYMNNESKEAGEIDASTPSLTQPPIHRPMIEEVEEKDERPPTIIPSHKQHGLTTTPTVPSIPTTPPTTTPNESAVPAMQPIKSDPPEDHHVGSASIPPTIQQPQPTPTPTPNAYQELGPASIFNQPTPAPTTHQQPQPQPPQQQPTPIVPQQQPYQPQPQQYHPNPQPQSHPYQPASLQPAPLPAEQEGQSYAPQPPPPQSQYQPQQPYAQQQPQQQQHISPYAQHQLMHGEGQQPLPNAYATPPSNQYYQPQSQPGYTPAPYPHAGYSQQYPNVTPPSNGAYPAVHPPPQPPQPQVPYHQHPPQANSYGTVAAVPKNNPYAGANPSPAAVEAANKAGIPLGLPVQPAMGELICPYCSVRLRYPLGSELVRCGGCQSISRIPPSAMNQPVMNYQHPVAAPPYQQPLPLPQQSVLPPPPQPNSGSTRVQFRCSGCQIWLAADMSAGGGVTRCPKCQTLMRPLLNMPPLKAPATTIKGPIPPPGVAPPTKQQLEQEQMMRDYYIANNIPYPLEGQQSVAASGKSSSWLQEQHEKVIKQQEELLARAKASKGQPQPVGVGAGAQPVLGGAKRAVPGDYSSVSHLDFQNNPSNSVVSPYNPAVHSYQPQQPQQQQQQQQQPVYPSMHNSGPVHSDYVAAPSSAGPSVAWSNPSVVPSAYARPSSSSVSLPSPSPSIHPTPPELKDEREKDVAFQASMAARLEALHVDSEEAIVDGEGAAAKVPGVYRPPKPRELRADEKSRPLLANEL